MKEHIRITINLTVLLMIDAVGNNGKSKKFSPCPMCSLLLPEQLISKEVFSDQDTMPWRRPTVRRIEVLKHGTDLLSSNCWCGCLVVRQGLRLQTDSAEC